MDALAAEPDPPTTVRKPAEAASRHVADSLSGLEVAALREATAVADLGSGAGFPGLVLAVALPDARVDLIEATERKCLLIARLARAAGAHNARAVAERAETWARSEGRGAYDAVTARALAPLAVLVEYAAPLLRPGGTLIAWKGARVRAEEAAAERAAAIVGMAPVQVLFVTPFAGARDRHLHVFVQREPPPARFPRRPGTARKRPLA